MKRLSLILIAIFAFNTWASSDLNQEMDALGANKELMKKARAIDPNNRVRVVQNRDVDLNNRIELGVNYGMYATGGDAYTTTTQVGGSFDYHFTPRWSLGMRYTSYNNTLNAEGNSAFQNAQQLQASGSVGARVPELDYAKNSYLAVGEFYPIYGKLNLFDTSISQFDIYLLGGAGQINLANNTSPLYSAGGGVAFWLTKHFATRFEARWQTYQESFTDGTSQNMNETVLTASISFLL